MGIDLGARLRASGRPRIAVGGGDLGWLLVVGGTLAVVVAYTMTVSVQVACSLVAVITVIALQLHDRRAGLTAVLVFWLVAPLLRRVFGLMTGYLGSDPLSVAPFVATAGAAGVELMRARLPTQIRQVLLLAAAGFAFGLPAGLLLAPQAAVYACVAYVAAITGALLALREPMSVDDSTLRKVLLYGVPVVAAYAVAQRLLPLPDWDRAWLDAANYGSIGVANGEDKIRVFSTLNGPGALAPVLALSLLTYLTVRRARPRAIAGAVLVTVALSYTLVRSAWVALIVAALAHVVVSRGRSARLVLGAGAVAVAATLALAPVNQGARDVLDRFNTLGGYKSDASATDRSRTAKATLPDALQAPIGHGLGSAGEPSKLISSDTRLRTPDNGYLSLLYQVGPIGFLLVMAAIGIIVRASWRGAQARAPGQDLRQLLFAMLVLLLVALTAGDELYGFHGVIFWLIGGYVLADDHRRRTLASLDRELRARRTELVGA